MLAAGQECLCADYAGPELPVENWSVVTAALVALRGEEANQAAEAAAAAAAAAAGPVDPRIEQAKRVVEYMKSLLPKPKPKGGKGKGKGKGSSGRVQKGGAR